MVDETKADAPQRERALQSAPLLKITAPLVLLLLTVVLFGPELFQPGECVLSKWGTDTSQFYVYARAFSANELRHGNLPLWNPYTFCGVPHLGSFQAALLYPPNLLYLVLPLAKAINATIALHTFLVGLFMYCWARYRQLSRKGGLFAASLLMCCSAYILHVYAGHLSNLCTMAWAPLVFLALDGILDQRSPWRWCLLGMLAAAMMVLAGHPQYVFQTAVAGGIYTAFRLCTAHHRGRVALGLLAMGAGAAALSAVQLMPGLEAGGESVRTGGISLTMARRGSFPPENLLTLLSPVFFGDGENVFYWGRWYRWEMTLYFGVMGLILAVYAGACGPRNRRRFAVTMTLVLMVLALGAHTPLFLLFYYYVPGFNLFRGSAKFIFQVSLFLTMLAGLGLDTLAKNKRHRICLAWVCLSSAGVLAMCALWMRSTAAGPSAGFWPEAVNAIRQTKDIYRIPPNLSPAAAGFLAAKSMGIAACTCALGAGLLWLARRFDRAVYAVALLGVGEVLVFACANFPTFDLEQTRFPAVAALRDDGPADARIWFSRKSSFGMSVGLGDIDGEEPGVLRRYAQLVYVTQGQDPDLATQYLNIKKRHRLLGMLRCKYAIAIREDSLGTLDLGETLPRVSLISECRVIPSRDDIFAALTDHSFDPRQTVILETAPEPAPTGGEGGTVKILHATTDTLTVEADLPHPAVLLITDAYSKGWRARPLEGSVQDAYEVMPANYALQAVPLTAGKHRLQLEYVPRGFQIGKWVSLTSLLAYTLAVATLLRRRKNTTRG